MAALSHFLSCVITNCSYNLIASSILDILRKKVFVLISENMNIIFKEQIQEYQPIRQIYKSINVWEKCEFKLSLIYSKINRLQKCSDGISLFQSSAFTKEEKHGISNEIWTLSLGVVFEHILFWYCHYTENLYHFYYIIR